MFLSAQAQLSRSKYNSGRGQKLENVQNTREILQPPLRISQRSLCRKTRAIRGTHNRRWPPNNDGLLPSLDHQTALCCPHGGALYPPPYKSAFRPSHVSSTSSSRPRPPPDGHALCSPINHPTTPPTTHKIRNLPKQKTPTVLPPRMAQGQSVEEPHKGRRRPKTTVQLLTPLPPS